MPLRRLETPRYLGAHDRQTSRCWRSHCRCRPANRGPNAPRSSNSSPRPKSCSRLSLSPGESSRIRGSGCEHLSALQSDMPDRTPIPVDWHQSHCPSPRCCPHLAKCRRRAIHARQSSSRQPTSPVPQAPQRALPPRRLLIQLQARLMRWDEWSCWRGVRVGVRLTPICGSARISPRRVVTFCHFRRR